MHYCEEGFLNDMESCNMLQAGMAHYTWASGVAGRCFEVLYMGLFVPSCSWLNSVRHGFLNSPSISWDKILHKQM